MDVFRLMLTRDCFYCLILYGFSNEHVDASDIFSIGSHLLSNIYFHRLTLVD